MARERLGILGLGLIGGSLALFAWRAPKVSTGGNFGLVSRETMLLMNNVLLVVAVTKAHEGAWIILLLIPLNVLLFRATRTHYDGVAAQLSQNSMEGIFVKGFVEKNENHFVSNG